MLANGYNWMLGLVVQQDKINFSIVLIKLVAHQCQYCSKENGLQWLWNYSTKIFNWDYCGFDQP